MDKRERTIAGAVAVTFIVLGSAAIAQSVSIAPPTPAQIIHARQASLEMSAVTFGHMKQAMATGGDATKQGFAAGALAQWALALPSLFPSGTGAGQTPVETKVRSEVWSDRATFNARASDYAMATAKLADLAKSGDAAGFTAQLDAVKGACDACHKDFKVRE